MSTPIDVQAQADFHRFTFAQARGKRLSVKWWLGTLAGRSACRRHAPRHRQTSDSITTSSWTAINPGFTVVP